VLAGYGADVIKVEPPDGDVIALRRSVRHRGMGPCFCS